MRLDHYYYLRRVLPFFAFFAGIEVVETIITTLLEAGNVDWGGGLCSRRLPSLLWNW